MPGCATCFSHLKGVLHEIWLFCGPQANVFYSSIWQDLSTSSRSFKTTGHPLKVFKIAFKWVYAQLDGSFPHPRDDWLYGVSHFSTSISASSKYNFNISQCKNQYVNESSSTQGHRRASHQDWRLSHVVYYYDNKMHFIFK